MPMSHAEEFVSKCTLVTLNLLPPAMAGAAALTQNATLQNRPAEIAENRIFDIVRSILFEWTPARAKPYLISSNGNMASRDGSVRIPPAQRRRGGTTSLNMSKLFQAGSTGSQASL